MNQLSIFDGTKAFHNDKPIRLIELFGGYGSQALALKYLGITFEHYRLSEWAVKSIQAYKDMHCSDDNTDYSKDMSVEQIKAWLYGKISADYNTPMTEQQINRLSEKQVRKIYNNMRATHNLGSIAQIKAKDLAVVDTDKYCYIMTYSFPCQDLSQAGKGKGMSKGSGTRSGLLWEVERLLREMSGYMPHRVKPNGKILSATPFVDWYHPADTSKLPQILLMENVPQVHGKGNKQDFYKWCNTLEDMGYKNYFQDLNSKDFEIPQNRNRCFMISLLGDYYYSFPKAQKLTVRLKDFLDKKVDEKYYLSDKTVEIFIEHTRKQQKKGNGFRFEPTSGGYAKSILTRPGERPCDNYVIEQGNAIQENSGLCSDTNGERLQGIRKSSNDGGSREKSGGGSDGVLLGKTPNFQRGPLKDMARAIMTDGMNGVVEWKK